MGGGGRGGRGKKTLIGSRGGSFPVCFCGAGLSKKALAELDLLANKQRICSHREPRLGQYRPPAERGTEGGGAGGNGRGRKEGLKEGVEKKPKRRRANELI